MVKAMVTVAFAMLAFNVGAAQEPGEVVLIDGPEVDLTLEDLRKTLLSAPQDVREGTLRSRAAIVEVMNSTYQTKVAAHRARKKGLDKRPEVTARIWNITLNALAGAELDDVVEATLNQGTDFEPIAREQYLVDKENYRMPEKVKLSHILLAAGGEAEDDSAVLAQLKQIKAEIESGKTTFEEAARNYSTDNGSAVAGGDLGWITRGRLVKPVEEAAFTLKPGQISEPVKSRFGYHLLLVKERAPSYIRAFDEVKDDLVKKVKARAITRIKEDYWLQIEGDAQVRMNTEAIEAFIASPGVDSDP